MEVGPQRPIPPLVPALGWAEVPIAPVDEPLVPVAAIGSRVVDDPRYHAMGLPGAPAGGWVRQGVAERLARAAGGLPGGMCLIVWDGWRALETQAALYEGYLEELAMEYPDLTRHDLELVARPYVTPPRPDPSAPPPHLTGGAVDVTLGDADGLPLDLGTDHDAFVPEAGAMALEGIDLPARELRRLLFWAMSGQGFTQYLEEWWHFDFGNQFWGRVTGRTARYAAAGPPGSS